MPRTFFFFISSSFWQSEQAWRSKSVSAKTSCGLPLITKPLVEIFFIGRWLWSDPIDGRRRQSGDKDIEVATVSHEPGVAVARNRANLFFFYCSTMFEQRTIVNSLTLLAKLSSPQHQNWYNPNLDECYTPEETHFYLPSDNNFASPAFSSFPVSDL